MLSVSLIQKVSLFQWAVAKSPLILGEPQLAQVQHVHAYPSPSAGTDLTKMSPELLKLVTNHELIAINKDSLGVQGHKLMSYSAPKR